MTQRLGNLQQLEVGGGLVTAGAVTRLTLPPDAGDYANAQIDDTFTAGTRKHYPWTPGTRLSLAARFSHQQHDLVGTAGFGFWNAPFGDPANRWPALPQASWFFFAARPTDLPLANDRPGRGWFASTIDATQPKALALAPLAPVAILLNQSTAIRRRLWPSIRQQLSISFAPIAMDMTAWHTYALDWHRHGCRFMVDGAVVLDTPHSPRGPLGFVCWIDNQYLVATPRGCFSWGVTKPHHTQWLEVSDLTLGRVETFAKTSNGGC